MNTGNFRTAMFGGFNKSDVSKYIVKLANERNEYKKRAEQAEEKLQAAEEKIAAAEAEVCCCEEVEEVTEEAAEETAEAEPAEEMPDEVSAEETETAEEPVEMEPVISEIVENVADIEMEKAILEIVENVTAIQNEINDKEKLTDNTSSEVISDRITRVLGMLESTEAQFGLLAKTLKEIKSDVRG